MAFEHELIAAMNNPEAAAAWRKAIELNDLGMEFFRESARCRAEVRHMKERTREALKAILAVGENLTEMQSEWESMKRAEVGHKLAIFALATINVILIAALISPRF